MNRYKILRQKTFESIAKFDQRINEECARDWKIMNVTATHSFLVAILERENRK